MNKDMQKITNIITKYLGKKKMVLQLMYEIQNITGYLDEEIIKFVSDKIGINFSSLTEQLSLFSFFKISHSPNKLIKITYSPDCFIEKIKYFEIYLTNKISKDLIEKVEDENCINGPVLTIGNKKFYNVSLKDIEQILENYL